MLGSPLKVLFLGQTKHVNTTTKNLLRKIRQCGGCVLTDDPATTTDPRERIPRTVDGIIKTNGADWRMDEPRATLRPPKARPESLIGGQEILNYLENVFGYRRLRRFIQNDISTTKSRLYDFQGKMKYELMAHDPSGQKKLGRMVATAESAEAIRKDYFSTVRQILAEPITRNKHYNVLEHLLGHLPEGVQLRESVRTRLEHYKNRRVPWIIPFNLLRRYFRNSPFDWLRQQSYLFPGKVEYPLKRWACLRKHPSGIYRTS